MAAFFIITIHIHNNQTIMELPHLPNMAFLYKGAVSFFFTLSGFLITYIRITEYEKKGDINIKIFFSNRFYGWLIINVAANPRNIIKPDNKLFDWIGQRTYGIYMYHMFVLYLISCFFSTTEFLFHNFSLYIICYYLLVFGITTGVSHFSFTYIEKPIIRWTKRNNEKRKLKKPRVKILKRIFKKNTRCSAGYLFI